MSDMDEHGPYCEQCGACQRCQSEDPCVNGYESHSYLVEEKSMLEEAIKPGWAPLIKSIDMATDDEDKRFFKAHGTPTPDSPIIYYAAAIRSSDGAGSTRDWAIINALREAGYTVLSGIGNGDEMTDEEIYQRDLDWLIDSNTVIADVTEPSHGVGYEIAQGLHWGNSVLCLAKRDVKVSAMLTGNSDLVVKHYGTTEEAISLALEFCKQ